MFGRDPWKSADITAFGAMLGIAQGRTSWLAPSVGGLPVDAAVLPYWLGAAFIALLQPVTGPAFAARIPFALLLCVVLVLTWYASFHLARTEAAQPLPLAFGGEANVVDYARAIADGALLALIACLGLLQLGHETTPEMVQLAGRRAVPLRDGGEPVSRHSSTARRAVRAACAGGERSAGDCRRAFGRRQHRVSSLRATRRRDASLPWVLGGGAARGRLRQAVLGAWDWRLGTYRTPQSGASRCCACSCGSVGRRGRWRCGHCGDGERTCCIGTSRCRCPCMLVALAACVAMGGSDRALMLGLPAIAVLAAFALPTLKRSLASAIDWFSVFFFSTAALAIWVIYVALQFGVPAKPAANVAKLAPGFIASFSLVPLMLAIVGTFAWGWLVKWRTGPASAGAVEEPRPARERGGAVLAAADDAAAAAARLRAQLPSAGAATRKARAARRMHRGARHAAASRGGARIPRALSCRCNDHDAQRTRCEYLMVVESVRDPRAAPPGWKLVARERRPTDRDEATAVLKREAPIRAVPASQ